MKSYGKILTFLLDLGKEPDSIWSLYFLLDIDDGGECPPGDAFLSITSEEYSSDIIHLTSPMIGCSTDVDSNYNKRFSLIGGYKWSDYLEIWVYSPELEGAEIIEVFAVLQKDESSWYHPADIMGMNLLGSTEGINAQKNSDQDDLSSDNSIDWDSIDWESLDLLISDDAGDSKYGQEMDFEKISVSVSKVGEGIYMKISSVKTFH